MKLVWLTISLFLLQYISFAQEGWYMNFSPGLNYVPPMPLKINQEDCPAISIWANYETASLKSPVYYSCRLGFIKHGKGCEIEMNHAKIYLKNKPSEIQRFSISHGYNQLFLNKVFYKSRHGVKFGAGVVIAHPESTIRNMGFDEKQGFLNWGYYLAGPVFQCCLFKDIDIVGGFYLLIESKVSLAYANVPVCGGRAHVPLLGIHVQAGPGFRKTKKRAPKLTL